jgi:phage terminase Nu1 subunit (DNA packaging protein)
MAKKKKAKWKPRKATKHVDSLGCYRKHLRNGEPVTRILLNDVPVRLKKRFKAALEIHGDTIARALPRMMLEYAKMVELKYNVFLDPETPKDYSAEE